MKENNPHILGTEKVGKLLLEYSIPAIIGMTLTSLYNIIDSVFIGHGVGASLHEAPEIPNYGKPGHGMRLMPGMTFCIEPMINGKGDAVRVLGDGWTVVTRSGSLAAHFEHEIAVTQDGPVILTRP